MPTLEIYANELITVSDLFGTIMVAIRKWASNFAIHFADESDEEAESAEGEEEDNKDPPTLSVQVKDVAQSKDIFGRQ